MFVHRFVAPLGAILLASAPTFAAPRATQSSPIAHSADGKLLINCNPDDNSVSLFSTTDTAVRKIAKIKVGQEPVSVAMTPNRKRAFVANMRDGTVSELDLKTRTVVRTLMNVGTEPTAVALSPNATRLYVSNSLSNNVKVFNITGTQPGLIATIDLSAIGNSPGAIAVTSDGDTDDTDETVFVAIFYGQLRAGKSNVDEGQDDQREGRVVAISAATNAVALANPVAVLSPLADTGFASNGKLAPAVGVVPAVPSTNPPTFTTATGAFPNQLASIAINPVNGQAYVVSTGASPNGPLRFNQMAQGLVSIFDVADRHEIVAAQSDTKFRRTAPLNMNQGVNLDTAAKPRFFHTNPVAIAWRGNKGKDAWVAIQNSDLVVRLKVDGDGIPTVGAPLAAGPGKIVRVDLQKPGGTLIRGKAPRGIAINQAGTRAFVSNFISRSVSMIDISHPNAPKIISTAQSTKLPAAGTEEETLQIGAELFYTGRGPQKRMSSESWGGCIVCHPNGRSDNVTWMFDAGPRQTIPLDGTFNKNLLSPEPRILNWSAVRDENQDFELNTRGVFGGRGIIEEDRLFLAFAGEKDNGDSSEIEQFEQFTGVVGTTNDLTGEALPNVPRGRRDFAIATLGDGRVFIIGGRSGGGNGKLITGNKSVVEFDPLSNTFTDRSHTDFTPRHSLGAAAVRTSQGFLIYAIGGYSNDDPAATPASIVEEYDPNTNSWRTVASLPTAVAQFGIAVAGGINTAEPLELVHVVSGNIGSESVPSVTNLNPVQRFQPDPIGLGTWSAFTVPGLTLRRNHGAATTIRGTQSRIFVIGGQNATDAVLDTVEEYAAQAVVAIGPTTPPGAPFFGPHPARTPLPAARARFGIANSLSTNQIYVIGGLDGAGTPQSDIFEYTANTNGAVPGVPGAPTGAWVDRANLAIARAGLGVSKPSGVTNLLPVANHGRSFGQDAMTAWIQQKVRAARAPVATTDLAAQAGRTLFGTVGLVQSGFSCATCHGGPKWTRSIVDYIAPPSPEVGLGLGNQRVIGAELRQTLTQNPAFPSAGQFPGVLINVGTFTANSPGGRVNEIRANGADSSQAVAPLGANGFNIPSVLSVAETAPYFYSGLAQTLNQVLDGSQDGNGGVRHHFVTDGTQRAQLIAFLRSIDDVTQIFP